MIQTVSVVLVPLPHGEDLPLPEYATPESAGVDLRAAIEQPLTLNPGGRLLIPTGLLLELPQGYEAQIRPRSGLALDHGITVLNAPGTVDSDYRGELKVLLINHDTEPFVVERGMKIAQLVIAPVVHAQWQKQDTLSSATLRGVRGFGSTGY